MKLTIFFSLCLNNLKVYYNLSHRVIFLVAIFLILSIALPINIYFPDTFFYPDNYITGVDLLSLFYLIFTFSFIYLFYVSNLNHQDTFLSLVFLSSITLTLIFIGNSILYERINWLSYILSIFIVSSFFSSLFRVNISNFLILFLFITMCLTMYVHLGDNLQFIEEFNIKYER